MIPCRFSNHLGMKHPPDWDGDPCAEPRHAAVERKPSGQQPSIAITRRLDWRGKGSRIDLSIAGLRWPAPLTAPQKTVPPLKMPIAPMAGDSGLAQHVFPSPARTHTEVPTTMEMCAAPPAKNAIRYATFHPYLCLWRGGCSRRTTVIGTIVPSSHVLALS